MRNRIAALIQEGVLDAPPLHVPARATGESGFAGIPGLRVVAEVPLLEDTLRPYAHRRAALAPAPDRSSLPSYALDPRPEDAATLNARRDHMDRAAALRRVLYRCAATLSVLLTIALGLVILP
ncbi:MAG: hypothetical protein WEB88_11655 [Gemmatimonadota bacterium]